MRRRAFTLVEILVVIGILSLLLAILLPVLARVRAAGRSSVCLSNLRQLGMAVELYTQDYEHYPRGLDPADKFTPEIWAGHPDAHGDVLAATPLLTEVLASYVKNSALWHCPSDFGFDITDITGLALDARPSCYEKFAMSYFYRSEITLLNLRQEHLPRPTETHVLADADGLWHGTGILGYTNRRYNVLFADGHAKNLDRDAYLSVWDVPIK